MWSLLGWPSTRVPPALPPAGTTTCSTGPSASSSTQDFQCWRQMGRMAGISDQHWILKYSLAATLAKAPAIGTIEMSVTLFISRTVSKENILASSGNLAYMSTNQTTTSTRAGAKLEWVMMRNNTPCRVGKISLFRDRQSTTTHFKRWWQLCLTSKVPSAGWMFLPLTGYYVSDPEVVFEPMTEHLSEYSWGLAQYLGAGVAACYRGHRLFDSPATRCISDCSKNLCKSFPGRWSGAGSPSTRNIVRCWGLTWCMWGDQTCRWGKEKVSIQCIAMSDCKETKTRFF